MLYNFCTVETVLHNRIYRVVADSKEEALEKFWEGEEVLLLADQADERVQTDLEEIIEL